MHETPDASHEPNQFDLMRQRRFAPFFWTQFADAWYATKITSAFL